MTHSISIQSKPFLTEFPVLMEDLLQTELQLTLTEFGFTLHSSLLLLPLSI